jgi:hypothetical protein
VRRPSCLSPRRSKRPAQIGLRGLIVGISLLSVLLAIGMYLWAILLFVTAAVVAICHLAAAFLDTQPHRDHRSHTIPRFWHRRASAAGASSSIPMVVALIHTGLFVIWHLFMFITWKDMRLFFDSRVATGVTLRGLDHASNAAMLGYLLAHLLGGLLPASDAPRQERVHLALMASLVAMLHLAIA